MTCTGPNLPSEILFRGVARLALLHNLSFRKDGI